MPRAKANKAIVIDGSVDKNNTVSSTINGTENTESLTPTSKKPRGRAKVVDIKNAPAKLEKAKEITKSGRSRKKIDEQNIEVPVAAKHDLEVKNLPKSRGKKTHSEKSEPKVENKIVSDKIKGRKKKTTSDAVEENLEQVALDKNTSKKKGATAAAIVKNEEIIEKAVAKKRSKAKLTQESEEKTEKNKPKLNANKRVIGQKQSAGAIDSEEIDVPLHTKNLKQNKEEKAGNGIKKKNGVNNVKDSNDIVNETAPTKRGRRKKDAVTVVKEEQNSEEKSVEKKSQSRKRASGTEKYIEFDEINEKPAKIKKENEKKSGGTLLNPTDTIYNKEDFELTANSNNDVKEPHYNLKISSWNVAGLRSWLKKDGLKYLNYEEPDIFCMQEIKCTTDQLPDEAARIAGYHPYWLCMPGGYAGVAIYSKIMPINVEYGIGNGEFDAVGRIITAEYEKFFLINVYVPNSGRKLVNLEARMRWEKLFQEFVKQLDSRKPIIICGDMNVSHNEIDLANPKSNTRSAGFTKEEREKMTELLSLGFVDTFRHLYPERKGAYTYWTYMANARARNVGWRLDYFITSERFLKRVVDNCIRSQVKGSDHCPITLYLNL